MLTASDPSVGLYRGMRLHTWLGDPIDVIQHGMANHIHKMIQHNSPSKGEYPTGNMIEAVSEAGTREINSILFQCSFTREPVTKKMTIDFGLNQAEENPLDCFSSVIRKERRKLPMQYLDFSLTCLRMSKYCAKESYIWEVQFYLNAMNRRISRMTTISIEGSNGYCEVDTA